MQTKRGNGLAVVLIFIGALMLMGIFGSLVGGLLGLLFPILMIALGYYGIKRGKTVIGWIILAVGVLMLIGKLSWFIGPLLGIILLVYGISLLMKKRTTY